MAGLLAATPPPEPVHPRRVFRAALREDFGSFLQYAFGVVNPSTLYLASWHIDGIAHKLSLVESGQIRRLIITLPPRSLKSISASVALPAWYLGRHPAERVLAVSYSEQLAKAHASDFRLVVNDPTYRAAFPGMRIARDTERETVTTERGRRFATSIEGTLTGLGGNLVIIDDPIKPGDVYSEAARLKVLDWYRSTLLTRPDDKKAARIVLVMQRVHTEDLAGYLIEQGGFDVLNLPAIATEDAVYDVGHGYRYTRRAGELLHPDHEPASVLAEIKREMGPVTFSAQYQQRPVPFGGTIIKRDWLKATYEDYGQGPSDRIIVSWDVALSEAASGDYSAGVVLQQRGESFNVLEVIRGRFPFETLKRIIIETSERYGSPHLLIEDSPISKGLIQALQNLNINVVAIRPDTDKRARLISQTDLFHGGSIRLPVEADWLEPLTAELLAFPSRYDDQVDALTQGLAWARERPRNGGGVSPVGGHF